MDGLQQYFAWCIQFSYGHVHTFFSAESKEDKPRKRIRFITAQKLKHESYIQSTADKISYK